LNAPLPAPEDYKWELYDLTKDYSQANDLAGQMPDKLKQMQSVFDQEAKKYEVYPLNNDTFARALAPRPSATAGKTVFIYSGVLPGLDPSVAPQYLARSYTITAEVDVPEGGGDGMIVTEGGRFGGIGLYILKGKPVFDYNMLTLAQYRWASPDALTPGKHTIVFDFTYDGPGVAKGGTGVLKVDGKEVDNHKQPNSIAFLEVTDETFDVGVDTRTGVNDDDYQVPFAFNGTIEKLTFKMGQPQMLPSDAKAAKDADGKAND
jgi:hypothetical protein